MNEARPVRAEVERELRRRHEPAVGGPERRARLLEPERAQLVLVKEAIPAGNALGHLSPLSPRVQRLTQRIINKFAPLGPGRISQMPLFSIGSNLQGFRRANENGPLFA